MDFFELCYLTEKFSPSSVEDVQALIKVKQHMLRVADVKLLITHFCPAAKNTQMAHQNVWVYIIGETKDMQMKIIVMCSETAGAAGSGTAWDVRVIHLLHYIHFQLLFICFSMLPTLRGLKKIVCQKIMLTR